MPVKVEMLSPSGLTRWTDAAGFVTFVIWRNTLPFAVPLKLSRASCRGTLVVTATGGPSISMLALTSETSLIPITKLPVLVIGSIPIVYVPVVGRTTLSGVVLAA